MHVFLSLTQGAVWISVHTEKNILKLKNNLCDEMMRGFPNNLKFILAHLYCSFKTCTTANLSALLVSH